MAETFTKKKFQIGDIAVLENQDGEQFLYDVKGKKLIGNSGVTYKSSIKAQSAYSYGLVGDIKTGMILQKSEDGKRCRIYDALHKKMIVENWEYVASSKDGAMDLVAVVKNPETQKYHVFHSCFMGIDGYDIFDKPIDRVKICDSDNIGAMILTVGGKNAYYYAYSKGLLTGFDHEYVEQIQEDDFLVGDGSKVQFVLDGDISKPSEEYDRIIVSDNYKPHEDYFLYCNNGNQTDIFRANWRGIKSRFTSDKYDGFRYLATMGIEKDEKGNPNQYATYFFGDKDGKSFLLKGVSNKGDQDTVVPLQVVKRIVSVAPLKRGGNILNAEDGKQGLLITYPIEDFEVDFDRKGKSELFEPNYDMVSRFGKKYVFALTNGNISTIYSSNIYFQSKGGCEVPGIEVRRIDGDIVIFKHDGKYGLAEVDHSYFHPSYGMSNVRYLGGGFYEYTKNGRKGVFNTINNICDEIHYVGSAKENSSLSEQFFIAKVNGKYDWLEYDPCCPPDPSYDSVTVHNDGREFLKADKLSVCGKIIHALKGEKSTLYTHSGTVVKAYDGPVAVSMKEIMGNTLYVVEGDSFVDYYEFVNGKFKPVEIINISVDSQPVQKKKGSKPE